MKYKIDNVERILKDKDFDIFIHGCNAQGKFRSGIAGIVRKVYPDCAKLYEANIDNQNNELGDQSYHWVLPDEKAIVNAITQENYGYNGKKYASYDAIDTVFSDIAFYVKEGKDFYKDSKIYYPLIGCGLGGLQWSVVKEIIDYRLKGLDHYCIVREEDIIKHKIGEASLLIYNELRDAWDEDGQGNAFKVLDQDWKHFKEGTSMLLVNEWFEETFNISVGQRYF